MDTNHQPQSPALAKQNQSLAALRSLKNADAALLLPTLTRVSNLMGGGNTPEQVTNYAEATVELYPDLSGKDLEKALIKGLREVDWNGRLTFMAIAKFIRHFQINRSR